MARYPKGMPGRQAATSKTLKPRKVREMNPVKLVLDRGLHTITKPDVDEEGNDASVTIASPQGVVLGPFQAQALAAFINAQQQKIQTLDGIIAQMEKDAEGDDKEETDENNPEA